MLEINDLKKTFENGSPALKGVNLKINKGEFVSILGPSGSGKTILGELVQGLFNPNDGKVFIDGNDIRTFNIQHLRSQISIVGGNQYFFPGSIRENMQRIFPNANNDRILWATKLAKVSEDIEKLEKGYETPLGDSVAEISPAMKQKLAIARAIIRNPKILVLLGSTAMNALIGDAIVISKMRGKWIEKQFGSCKTSVIITFHPAFLMRQPAQKKLAWIDLKMIRDKKNNLKI